MKGNEQKKIQTNYLIVAIVFGFIIIAIVVKAFVTAFIEKESWLKVETTLVPAKVVPVPAMRGNIYSCDNELMATSEYRYRLYMDYWADGLKADTLMKYIRPLSVELNKLFPQKSASQYESDILAGWKAKEREEKRINDGEKNVRKNREYRLAINEINYSELKKVRKMPFFKLGPNKSGLYTKSLVKRTKPFGTLASRAIGDIYGEFDKGGKNGLELAYDSLLSGKPGLATRQRIQGRNIEVIDEKPVSGCDIISTIDINMQDITEKALSDKLNELDAESGTAVLMEVETGEIKAITNMGRVREGVWGETKNYAVSDLSEPGSTFKVASMMVALDDGVIQPNDPVDVGNGVFSYGGSSLLDHNAHRGGYGMITAAKTIWFSSNIGVAKIILRGYEHNPGKYVDGLYRIGFNKDLNLEIPGYGVAKIRHPKESSQTWYKTTLPWMSFGYETQIPPIYTLTFFNAIANNGTMIKPIFVKEIQENGSVRERKKTEVINKHICKDLTLSYIREMLDSVVNHPNGTGKPAHSDLVRISGKTGTAQISHGSAGYKAGGLSHQVSFCGYFPSDNPKYSCIVVIRKPRVGNASGGFMCGAVFKKIAEEVFVQNIIAKPGDPVEEDIRPKTPKVKNGLSDHSLYVMNKLNVNYSDSLKGKWMSAQLDDDKLIVRDLRIRENSVPNVIGMGAKDAIYALEQVGINVNIAGRGEVKSQSISAGTTVSKGQTIAIQLK
ncbi:penicillin-binding protein [Bacteroidia bacterium]|nr:penicillin-binding protein [Bacteroidia bacterium]